MHFSCKMLKKNYEHTCQAHTLSYLYLHTLVQRSVHESVERQEEGANGVGESVPVLTVAIESENQGQTLHHRKSSL